MSNRRRAMRTAKRLKIEYGATKLDQRGVTHDISVGGLFLVAPRLIEIDTRLHMHIFAPEGDFYAEGLVVHVKRVSPSMQQFEPQGLGIRFLTTAECVAQLVPRSLRKVETLGLECRSAEQLRKLINDQLKRGALLVPVASPPPSINSVVEFDLIMKFMKDPEAVSGSGRVVQLLESMKGDRKTMNAVLEVQAAQDLIAALEESLKSWKM